MTQPGLTQAGSPRGEVGLHGIEKSFGATRILSGITLTVPAGGLTVLLGPSGCGKSTLLRIIAGLDAADSGTVRIGGRDVSAEPPARRGLAMVFQSYALFPHLTVAENILFGLTVRKVSRADRNARLARAAGLLGLTPLLERRPSQLSGGQQQRVALARAIVAEASVCLMDEPLSNLDAQLRMEMRREIRALQQRLGMTMIYVTHDQVEAMTMADRVVVMRAGHVEQNATPAELYERPQSGFVARFVGTPPMNVVPASSLAGQGWALSGAPGDPDGLSLGVRPESVRLDPAGVPAEVVGVEYLGADTLIETRLGGASFVARASGCAGVAAGDTVRLAWSPGDAHWFDRASETRAA
ncbi:MULTISPECIES: ABC transporter ATP-binding protein [Methylobacterium]|uniref:ABC transporter ATP-binding protein n=1 Tax=Methylobacterium TaxID=407 RepID=UPI0013EB883D|nr:ABC transporter ATP-binding protein [Methylobacterium sp. DB0501]NGM38082.1 ABC transporter ATP-binding protein [Methylobacterium sp. DB0501]